MPEQRGNVGRWHQLRAQFLMAARRQENQLSLSGDPAINRVVGRGIARVQSDHNIDAKLLCFDRLPGGADFVLVDQTGVLDEPDIGPRGAGRCREHRELPLNLRIGRSRGQRGADVDIGEW